MNIHFYNLILLIGMAISILAIIILLFPHYSHLGVIIVFLGALLVYLVGESYYRGHIENKQNTFLQKINPIISTNIDRANLNIHIIKDKPAGWKLNPLKNLWEARDPDPSKIGLKEEMSRNLLILKESTEEINENISNINALKVKFNTLKDSAELTDIMGRIVSFENDLEVKLNEFVKNSGKIFVKIEKLISK